MRFEFATASRIVFGPGTLAEIGTAARGFGGHALVVTGRDPGRAEPLLGLLRSAGLATTVTAVAHEPSIEDIDRGVAVARAAGADFVIGFGGGSALDAAKTGRPAGETANRSAATAHWRRPDPCTRRTHTQS